ncbi:MAG: hypothetical protein IJD38_11580 [Clostridia bacterium]|nr:hypothetical protein [Clostridia bacterium]
MKKTNLALNALLYFFYFVGSCITVMLAEALLIYIIEKFVGLPYPVLTVIRIVIYTAGVTALLVCLGHAEGYREAVCPVGETIASGVLASLAHLIFAMLFKFQGFISGGVRFTAGLIHNGWSVTYESLINETPYLLFVAVCLVYSALYVAALTLAKRFGAAKRVMDRAELRRDEQNP